MADTKSGPLKSLISELPLDRLREEAQNVAKAMGENAMSQVGGRVSGLTDKLTGGGEGGSIAGKAASEAAQAKASGDSPAAGALKGGVKGVAEKIKEKVTGGGGGNKSNKATKAINIIESIDVGVPIRVAYDQWTTWSDFPSFMKKVESADLEDGEEETKVNFKAQVFLSHRAWSATVTKQVPEDIIVWTSRGDKGHVDGAVSFHELAPNLTRILVVLEYYPQGLFEWVGNRWRAQGRRARLEIKNFRRHVMTRTVLDPESVEGWRGTVEDSEVVTTHEEALEQEEQEREDQEQDDQAEDEGDESEEEYDEDTDGEEEAEEEEEEEEEEPEEEEEKPRRRKSNRRSKGE